MPAAIRRPIGAVVATVAAVLLPPVAAVAQTYPSKSIRIIVPYAPGGNIDITARTIAPGMSEALGQQVVIDNRGGAGGTLGTELGAKAAPDGYTLTLGSTGTLSTSPPLYPRLGYDPIKDFATTSLVSNVPLVLEIHPSIPAHNVKEFIALAKTRPGRITMGSSGAGTTNHLSGELFQSATGTKFIHIPYKGSGPGLVDLMGGQIDIFFDQLSASITYIQAGKMRALAVTTIKRAAAMPELPTIAESGIPGFDASTWTGVVLPAATPPDVVMKVHAALIKTLRTKTTQDNFARLGAETLESTPEEFARFVKADLAKWTKVIREAGIKLE
jgi:tripartite-type tricarboxylate transporter receptor subunit TctC